MMNDPENRCPEGLDSSTLLAYVDGEMDEAARRSVEQHVRTCPVCSSEVESLRRVNALLKDHPESLHPDEEALYYFATRSEDADGKIAAHLDLCGRCREEVELLLEMIAQGNAVPSPQPILPASLRCKLDRTTATESPSLLETLVSKLKDFISIPFQMPVSALATAAAALVITVLCLPPMWDIIGGPDKPREHGLVPGVGVRPGLSSGMKDPATSQSARLTRKSPDRPAASLTEGATTQKLPGMTVDDAKKSDFFTSFHLEQDGAGIPEQQRTILRFRPEAEALRNLVEVKVTLDAKQRIAGMGLELARSLIDDKQNGVLARDMAKSMLRSMVPEQDTRNTTDLMREIEFGDDPSETAAPSSGKRPELPTHGYQTFLGKRASFEQSLEFTNIALRNEINTRGTEVLLITVFLK